jgi:excisionase family DNA binding protein
MARAATQSLGQYLSLQDIVARAGIGYSTLRARIASGELAAVRVGGRYRVKEVDVLEMMKPVQPKTQTPEED